MNNNNKIVAGKLQHGVFFVNSLKESRNFYIDVLGLNFATSNTPRSSAAMKLTKLSINFLSCGFYDHDLALIEQPAIKVDNDDCSHFTFKLNSTRSLDDLKNRLESKNVAYTNGRILKSQNQLIEGLYFKDPNGHVIEVIE